MEKRTVMKLASRDDLWSTVEQWSAAHGYRQKSAEGDERIYQKGLGLLVAPMMLRVVSTEGATTMEAWIRVNPLVRFMTLFILPAEMGIQSGGIRAAAPRSIARKAVNKLLGTLGEPLIP